MDINLAAFALTVSLREVSHVCIRNNLQSVVVQG